MLLRPNSQQRSSKYFKNFSISIFEEIHEITNIIEINNAENRIADAILVKVNPFLT